MRAPRTPDGPAADAPGEPRRRGHAFHAAAAREALGVGGTLAARVAEVPAPAFCAAVAAAASGLAVLVRPQSVARPLGPAMDLALTAVLCAAVIVHARLGTALGERAPGLGAVLLPVAAMASLFIALAGTGSPVAMAAAVAGCAAVTGLAPHLDALHAAGREGARARVARDASGTAVMLPAVLAGASDHLALPVRAGVVLLLATLTTGAAVRAAGPRAARRAALGVGMVTAAAVPLAMRAGAQATGASGLLLLWYGLRGLAGASLAARRERLAAVEYLAVSLGALALLVTQGRG